LTGYNISRGATLRDMLYLLVTRFFAVAISNSSFLLATAFS
jgi:hypothetical protein